MNDERKTKKQLIHELKLLRTTVGRLERQKTTRKKSARTLKKSEELYRTLAETAHDIIFVINTDDRIEYVNTFGAALFGLQPKTLIGKSRTALFPSGSDLPKNNVKDVFKTSLPLYTENKIHFPKGELWLSTLLVPMRDKNKVVSVMGISRDITEHKLTQDALRKSEEKYRLLFYNSPIGIVTYDTNFHIINCNDMITNGLHVKNAGAKELDIKKLDDPRIAPALLLALEGKEGFYEGLYRSTLGTRELWISMHTAPLFDWDGNVSGGIAILEDITRRKEAELSLQHQLNFLQVLIDTMPSHIFYKDREGHFLGCNAAFESFLGKTKEDIIGKTSFDVFPPEIAAMHVEADQVVLEKQGIQQYETSATFPDGSRHTILINKTVFRDLTGKPAGLVGIASDISERKQAEEAISEQKKFAENLLENSSVATFVLNPEHKVLIWNKACEELTGYSAAHMIGTDEQWKPFYDHKRPDLADIAIDNDFESLPALYPLYSRSTLALNGLHAEGWFKNLAEKDRYLLFDAAPIYNSKGELIAAIEILQDGTERKQAEESLLESERKLRAITDTATDAIILANDEGKIIYWNSSANRMLGYSPEEIEGKSITLIIPTQYQDAHAKAFNAFAKTGQGTMIGKTYEVSALKKDESELPIELSISGILLQGKWHSAGIIRDISERKKLEAQLRHSQKMEAVGQLAGGIAHDFNNILTAIIGYGHLMQIKMNPDDPLRMNVNHILEAADRAANLTRSLLTFSRRQILNSQRLDLNEIIRRVERLLRMVIGEDIELTTSFKKDPLFINADSSQIEVALMNLATNARDAMPNGGTISIETDVVELDNSFIRAYGYGKIGHYAVIMVTDTGTGIDDKIRKRIFEPFFTTKEVGKGTGLGLSIVYGVIKQHHGYINVYSEPGKGTTFKIYLPLISESGIQEEVQGHAPSEEFFEGGETILLAEDDAAIRSLTRTILEGSGYRVVEAENGEEAIKKFMEHRETIHLILLDMIMPRKSGKEAFDEIKKMRPDIKALFVSGYTSDRLHINSIHSEGIELLSKPILPRTLLQKVRETLDKKKSNPENPPSA
ncbi:MAG: PAS domain S-box protein [Nitrospirota bacterium]